MDTMKQEANKALIDFYKVLATVTFNYHGTGKDLDNFIKILLYDYMKAEELID